MWYICIDSMKKYIFLCFSLIYLANQQGNLIALAPMSPFEQIQEKKKAARAIIVEHINSRISGLPAGEKYGLIKDSWERAIGDHDNAAIKILVRLAEGGMEVDTIKRLIDVLIGLGIDVNNPWTATYHISDIVCHMSIELLGKDVTIYKPICRAVGSVDVKAGISSTKQISLDFDEQVSSLADLRARYYELRRQQEELILSSNNFRDIEHGVSSSTREFLKKVIRRLLPIIWQELGIPQNSDAFIYLGSMGTFASDADLFYWGPEALKVNEKLAELLFLLGIKMDLFSRHLVAGEIEKHKIYYAIEWYFFFGGTCIDINNGSFNDFYREQVIPYSDDDEVWNCIYPYLYAKLGVWSGRRPHPHISLANFKGLQHRSILNMLFGFSRLFNISFDTDIDRFFEQLSHHIEKEEIDVLREAMVLTAQSRNLYQVITRRRWEEETDKIMADIERVLREQGVPDCQKKLRTIGIKLDDIRAKYLEDLPRSRDELPDEQLSGYSTYTDDQLVSAWRKTAENYLRIVGEDMYAGFGGQKGEKVRGIWFSDLDGTVLNEPKPDNPEPKLSESALKDEVLAILEMGYSCVFITGGEYIQAHRRLMEEIPVRLRKQIILAVNGGARIYRFNEAGEAVEDLGYRETEGGTYIKAEDRMQFEAAARAELRKFEEDAINGGDALLAQELAGICEPEQMRRLLGVEPRGTDIGNDKAAQIAIIGVPKQMREPIMERLAEMFRGRYSLKQSGFCTIEVNRIGVDKARVVEYILERAGVTPQECIYTGDNFKANGNDYAVTKVRGLGIIAVDRERDYATIEASWRGGNTKGTKAVLERILGKHNGREACPVLAAINKEEQPPDAYPIEVEIGV